MCSLNNGHGGINMTLANLLRLEEHFRNAGNEKEADFYKARAEKKAKRFGLVLPEKEKKEE